jgi:cytochrome c oxidase cbb3-type subunit 2/cytochrome c oxidase cbb3-type subunit I/II
MPGYPWLFGGSPRQPTQEALDLVAYLDFLGRDARVNGLDQQAPPRSMDPDDEARKGMFCDCAIPRTPGPAMLFSTEMAATERDRNVLLGKAVFARDCAGCHGAAGGGDGPAADSLLPRPRDLGSALFSDRALSEFLWSGVAGSSMPGWSELPASELRGLATFIHSLPLPATSEPEKPQSVAEQARARELFASNCITCHGSAEGKVRQPNAVFAPRPTNFSLVRPGDAYATAAVRDGVSGTAMPPWKDKLPEADRQLLTRYVRSLYDGKPAARE